MSRKNKRLFGKKPSRKYVKHQVPKLRWVREVNYVFDYGVKIDYELKIVI
jgi:hypothetical protein